MPHFSWLWVATSMLLWSLVWNCPLLFLSLPPRLITWRSQDYDRSNYLMDFLWVLQLIAGSTFPPLSISQDSQPSLTCSRNPYTRFRIGHTEQCSQLDYIMFSKAKKRRVISVGILNWHIVFYSEDRTINSDHVPIFLAHVLRTPAR